MPKTFDAATLATLHGSREVRIRTGRTKSGGVVIWIVVADGAVFVRSVRGSSGKWFIAAKRDGEAVLEVGGREFPVQVAPVTDQPTIDAVSDAYLTKYATSPYAQSMVRAEVLPTTLRLEPR